MHYTNDTPYKKLPKCYLPRTELMILKRKFLNLLYDLDSCSYDFISECFPLQCNIAITIICRIVEREVGAINRELLVLHKNQYLKLSCETSFF